MTATKPRVLIVYFTYTQQGRKVAEAMAEVLRERGCEARMPYGAGGAGARRSRAPK